MKPHKTRRFRPELDCLETRLVPTCTINQLDTDGDGTNETFQFIGDDLRQVLNVTDNAFQDHILVSLDCNGDGDFTDAGDMNAQQLPEFTRFDFQMGAGDDEINYGMNQLLFSDTRKIFVRLGAGTNRFTHTGFSNIDAGSSMKFKILDSIGADTIDIGRNGAVINSTFKVLADLGDGSDTFTLKTPDQFQGTSICDVDVFLGNGNNTAHLFLGSDVRDASLVDVDLFGGGLAGESDIVDGNLGLRLQSPASRGFVDLVLGAGNDQLDMDYSSEVQQAGSELRLKVKGDAGNDILVLTAFDSPADPGLLTAGLLDIRLDGGVDNDIIESNFHRNDGLNVTGNFLYRGKGGTGADIVSLDLIADATSTGSVDARLLGHDDGDILNLTVNNLSGGTLNFGPLAAILLDGGAGTDDSNITLLGAATPVQEVSVEA